MYPVRCLPSASPHAVGAEGVLQLACLRNARSLLRLSDLKRRGLCFGPPRCRLTSSVTRDNLAMSGSANLEKTPWTTRCRRETPTTKHDISELVGEVGETPDRFAVGADDDVAQDPGIEIDAAQAGARGGEPRDVGGGC